MILSKDPLKTDLYYELHEGNGPPLMMLHGFLSSRAQWMYNIEALKEVCSPVVIELYGHGRSPAPQDVNCYTPASYLSQFECIRTELGCDQWFICGYSLGAGLTVRYALEYPDRVIAHILTNSTSGFATEETTSRYRLDGESLLKSYEEGGLAAIEKIPVHPKFAKRLPDEIKQALLEDCAMLNSMGVARTIIYTNGQASVRDLVCRNSRPALLICGTREARFTPFRHFLESNMPDLEIIDVDAGHAVNAENPGQFNTAICGYINRFKG